MLNKQIFTSFLIISLLLIGTLLIGYAVQKQQQTKSNAAKATTLYFVSPTGGTIAPDAAGNLTLNVIANPGTNLLSVVKLEIVYDPSVFIISGEDAFSPNLSSFPTTLEGPLYTTSQGKISVTLSVGADPTRAITKTTVVGTLKLKTIAPKIGKSIISFSANTEAFSVGSSDQASENVISTTQPVTISLTTTHTASEPTPVIINLGDTSTSQTVAPTTIPTMTLFPVPTINPTATNVAVTILLHGIGAGGDNVNPNANTFSNKTPIHSQQRIQLFFYTAANQLFDSPTGTVTYSSASGKFIGTIQTSSQLNTGPYTVKIKINKYLTKLLSGIQTITSGKINQLPEVSLVTGDINGDNELNILDYNLLVSCYNDTANPTGCTSQTRMMSDLNDDGQVNQLDYNLFLRELSLQTGE